MVEQTNIYNCTLTYNCSYITFPDEILRIHEFGEIHQFQRFIFSFRYHPGPCLELMPLSLESSGCNLLLTCQVADLLKQFPKNGVLQYNIVQLPAHLLKQFLENGVLQYNTVQLPAHLIMIPASFTQYDADVLVFQQTSYNLYKYKLSECSNQPDDFCATIRCQFHRTLFSPCPTCQKCYHK